MNDPDEDFPDRLAGPAPQPSRPAVVPVADVQAVLDGPCTPGCSSWREEGDCSCLRERLDAFIHPPETRRGRPASPKQVDYVRGLLDSRVVDGPLRAEATRLLLDGLTDSDCRDLIPRLLACPKPRRSAGFDDDGWTSIDGNYADVPTGFPENPYEQ